MFYKQCTSVPESLFQIALSIIQLGNADYVAGIRLIPSKGQDVCLGYKAASKDIFLDVPLLRGFVLAMMPKGLRALQVITGERCTSTWIGSPDGFPRTRRLALNADVAALEVGFDGLKIVSLGVAESVSSPFDMSRRMALRDVAMWYPTIPDFHLDLNEDHFTGEDPSVSGYQPLCWTLFGGLSGIYLRSLTGISVSRLGYLYGIEFHYNTDQVPTECRKLGRHKSNEYERVDRFDIDGPGGEVIETVDVSLEYSNDEHAYSFFKKGKLRSFQIRTNRGNCCHFQPTQDTSHQHHLKPMNTGPGTTIVGLYGSQHPEMGLISLGVITDVISQG
ncbi:MAG: hypothetical protein M1831_004759 [Alyxoria varia]|nr:MAG: hypothetical protein M1831_004759 [Alyxoria varia]